MAGCSSRGSSTMFRLRTRAPPPPCPVPIPASQSGVAPVDLTQSGREAGGPVAWRVSSTSTSIASPSSRNTSRLEGHSRYLKARPHARSCSKATPTSARRPRIQLGAGPARAWRPRRSLALLGVPDAQMEAVSYGEEKPAAQGHSEKRLRAEPPRRTVVPLMAAHVFFPIARACWSTVVRGSLPPGHAQPRAVWGR